MLLAMITPKLILQRFYKILDQKKKDYGRGFNKFLCLETKLSSGFISQVVNKNQDPTPETQEKILNALKVDYQALLYPVDQPSQPADTKSGSGPQHTVSINDQETWQHFKTIKRFKNKGIALEINEKLADYEDKNSALKFAKLLTKIVEWIEDEEKDISQDAPTNTSSITPDEKQA